MLLEVLDGKTFVKLDLIRTFEFVQYSLTFSNVGDFILDVPLSERSLKYLTKGNMVLFDLEVLGIINYRKKEDGNSSYVTLKGKLAKKIISYRSFLLTEIYTGTIAEIVRGMLENNFIAPSDDRRRVPELSISTEEKYFPNTSENYSIQCTGKKVHDGIQNILSNKGWGYDVVPILQNVSDDVVASIKTLEFRIIQPTDRTIDNASGIEPVVFSKQLKNLKNTVLVEDDEDYANVMIVAGEGVGVERVVVEVGDEEAKGLARVEEYVDARDLQKSREDGTSMSDSEYEAILRQRGIEKQQEHVSFVYFDGTIITSNVRFVFGVDYFLGDLVSVIDEEFGIVLNVPIIDVTRSLTSTGEILDLTFGYDRMTVRELLKKEGVI